jgi:hypothetical protein
MDFHIALDNPVFFIDPDGMRVSPSDHHWQEFRDDGTTNIAEGQDSMGGGPPDWFVNNETGAVVYAEGQSTLTQSASDIIGAGNAQNYDRLGPDNMFGNKVAYGTDSNILDNGTVKIENPEKFMKNQGYAKAENVTIKESEYTSGGPMGNEERISQTTGILKQIGDGKITYAKPSEFNSKTGRENKYEGQWSSSKNITYRLTKPYGQDNHVTAEYYSNRSTDYATGMSIMDNSITILKAIIKSIK